MAIRSAWWMRELPAQSEVSRIRNINRPAHRLKPHQNWPEQPPDGLAFKELERQLKENPGYSCKLNKLFYSDDPGGRKANFGKEREAISSVELERLLLEQWPEHTYCALYIASKISGDALQLLGFHLNLTPRFFNFPYTIIGTGVPVVDFAFFGLQYMERYEPESIPREAGRIGKSPSMKFRRRQGLSNQTWWVTRINMIFIRVPADRPRYNGVIVLDPADCAVENALLVLARKVEEELPGLGEHKLGLVHNLCNVFYIVQFTWGCFLQESEEHLSILSQKCVEEDLSFEDQLTYTRELHKLVPFFGESRRRILGAKDAIQQMLDHPFFHTVDAQKSMVAYLHKTMAALDEYNTRSLEVSEQTNNLISLIFNIATLQDTRVAVEESRAANILAASIRRVTVLTFIYLPLMLSASVFGMNVSEITQIKSYPSTWIFAVVAAVLMAFTVGAWTLWSKVFDNDRNQRNGQPSIT